ncbi:MAG: hypothetical protein EHM70_22130 [Chloroflexota bacterium]|nr:MAG: hypothetical protein EHM70_22130 [Chloroflexota bacterium]
MYPYLTGSASWLLLTLLCESFGVQGSYGNLSLGPRLVSAQFDAHGVAGIRTQFAERCLEIFFHNPANLNYGQYQVQRILVDGVEETFDRQEERAVLRREIILELSARPQVHRIDVTLG